jgi:hypothetical protein
VCVRASGWTNPCFHRHRFSASVSRVMLTMPERLRSHGAASRDTGAVCMLAYHRDRTFGLNLASGGGMHPFVHTAMHTAYGVTGWTLQFVAVSQPSEIPTGPYRAVTPRRVLTR